LDQRVNIFLFKIDVDVVFLQECWLTSRKEFIDVVGRNSRIKMYYKPNDEYAGIGRHSGGIGWVVNKKIGKTKVEFINNRISILKVRKKSFIGVYLTSNNQTPECHIEYQLELNLISRIKRKLEQQGQEVVIIGDFNGDIIRNNKHDKCFTKFLKDNQVKCFDSITNTSQTWHNVKDSSHVDHIVADINNKSIQSVNILYNDKPNESDHWAINLRIECDEEEKENRSIKKETINWNDYTIRKYDLILKEKLSKFYYFINENIYNNNKATDS